MDVQDLSFHNKTASFLLGYTVGVAELESGAKLNLIASGSTVRFTVSGQSGYVELDLSRHASFAAAWLESHDRIDPNALAVRETIPKDPSSSI